ncbi:MAG: RHS repeat-associated core domain-containing protein [Bacteroidota bacterium]
MKKKKNNGRSLQASDCLVVFDEALNGIDMSGKGNSSTTPRAFLNYIFFDQEMNYVRAVFLQITTAAQGVGVHETISLQDIIADREGYILAYLSNENAEEVAIHWDDFKVYHGKTNVVFADSYYPFGLTLNSYERTASTPNRYKYNGKEEQEETGWLDYGARMYMPEIGRFFTQDRFAEKYYDLNSYQYGANNPILFIDINGDSLNVSDLQTNNAAALAALDSDLEAKTGLDLNADANGNVTFATEKGFLGIKKAKVARDADGKKIGSRLARKALKDAIKDDATVNIVDNSGGGNFVPSLGANEINFDISEVNTLMGKASSDLDPTTVGPALVFLHELGHTGVGGSRDDPSRADSPMKAGPNPRKINRMRRQLGKSFGIRAAYGVTRVGRNVYMPFSKKALRRLKKGKAPRGKFLKF